MTEMIISELQDLIFGLNIYEKTKIEERYEKVEELISQLSISTTQEFEILESCIFKIKEQLRIKSSNLNSLIQKRKLTKKRITEIISQLEEIKYEVIQFAFESSQSFPKKTIPKEIPLPEHSSELVKKEEVKEEKEIFETQQHDSSFSLSTKGKVTIRSKNELFSNSLSDFNSILTQLFNTGKYIATLVIGNKNSKSTQLLGINQNELHLSVLNQKRESLSKSVDEIYETIISHKSGEKEKIENLQEEPQKNEQVKQEDELYLTINDEKTSIASLKDDEDSLEALLSGKEDPKEFTPTNSTKNESIEDAIVIEKKDEEDQLIIERKDIELENVEIENPKENQVEPYPQQETFSEARHKNESKARMSREEDTIPKSVAIENTHMYSDENIVLNANPKGIHEGQIELEFQSNKTIEHINNESLVHATLFSKHILNTLFQAFQPQGTMLVSSLKSNTIHLIPRFIDDIIFKFNGQPQSEEALNQIQQKIQNRMVEEIVPKQKDVEKIKEPTEIQIHDNQETPKEPTSKKAEYLLSSLRRLA